VFFVLVLDFVVDEGVDGAALVVKVVFEVVLLTNVLDDFLGGAQVEFDKGVVFEVEVGDGESC